MRFYFYLFIFLSSQIILAQTNKTTYIFKNKTEGYNVYRIPTIIKSKSGKLLAICEGRRNLFDGGNIDLVMKSSIDNGQTWSALKVIWNDGNNTCGNPTPLVDKATGNVIILGTLNNDKVFVLTSTNEGDTWEKPIDITNDVKSANWKWYATGPVHGIQIENNTFANRIIIPCNHTVKDSDKHISHIIYSDDAVHWKLGGSVPASQTDECTVAELNNGNLMLNMRNNDKVLRNRKVSYSKDGGISWSDVQFDTSLIEPVCQAALLRYSMQPSILLFSNPKHKKLRKNLTLSISYDEGKTWSKQLSIHNKKSAYNDIVKLNDGRICCIYETGKLLPYAGIAIKFINSKEIEK